MAVVVLLSLCLFLNTILLLIMFGEKNRLMVVKIHMAYRNRGENIECLHHRAVDVIGILSTI